MWGPKLKYHLQGPGEATQWSSLYPSPSVIGAWEAFLWCLYIDLPSLLTMVPLVG
jgi:hypothetical protein